MSCASLLLLSFFLSLAHGFIPLFPCSEAHCLGCLFRLVALIQESDLAYVGIAEVEEAQEATDIRYEAVPLIVIVLEGKGKA